MKDHTIPGYIFALNELMVGIEEEIGEKLEWQISDRELVLIDKTSLSVIYEEILRLRNEALAK